MLLNSFRTTFARQSKSQNFHSIQMFFTYLDFTLLRNTQASFTRSYKKVLLTQDVEGLGFKGEWTFVKPGHAFNLLVPQGKALIDTDPDIKKVQYDAAILKRKQEIRVLEVFLSKLKDIRIIFDKEVSEINKNVAKVPVSPDDVLDQLNKRYNLGIKKTDFKMETGLDTVGEHFVQSSFNSEQFQKEFSFLVKVVIRAKKTKDSTKDEGESKKKMSAGK
eukprot:403371141